MDKKCCDNCEKCSCSKEAKGMGMECCKEHAMSKEHLEAKKEMLEEKLKWVTEEIEKSE